MIMIEQQNNDKQTNKYFESFLISSLLYFTFRGWLPISTVSTVWFAISGSTQTLGSQQEEDDSNDQPEEDKQHCLHHPT
jgi:hypothetical protein